MEQFLGSPVSFPGMTYFFDLVGIATMGLFLTTCLSAELCLTGSGSGLVQSLGLERDP